MMEEGRPAEQWGRGEVWGLYRSDKLSKTKLSLSLPLSLSLSLSLSLWVVIEQNENENSSVGTRRPTMTRI